MNCKKEQQMTDERIKQNETRQQISPLYLAQVNTEMLVADIRKALERALKDNMQFATAVGVLQFCITETIENAKAEVGDE